MVPNWIWPIKFVFEDEGIRGLDCNGGNDSDSTLRKMRLQKPRNTVSAAVIVFIEEV